MNEIPTSSDGQQIKTFHTTKETKKFWHNVNFIILTFRRRNYFFLILAHTVYKMWIIQEPNKLELWNKLHFKEKKKRRVYTVFKIFGSYIC